MPLEGSIRRWLLPLLLGCVMGSCLRSPASDWPQWRGPDLNGISKETGWTTAWPKEGPAQLWKASVGIGFSSLAVAQGRVFTLGNTDETDTVFCFDAETGRELWRHAYPCALDPTYYEGGPGSTPTVEAGKVYTLSKRGHLFCFEAATGKVVWQTNLLEGLHAGKPRWGFASSPLVQENLLILNVGGAGTAVEKETGKVVWTSNTNTSGYATPMPFTSGGAPAVAIFAAKALVGVAVKDGKLLWEHPWPTRWEINNADPILVGDAVFVSSFDRGCALLELGAAKPIVSWENKNMANHFNSCVFLGGYFYGVNGNTDQPEKDFRCLDLAKGELKWKHDGLGLGSVMAADGKLIILSERGELIVTAASPESFKPLARAQVLGGKCWTTPVLASGRIYCRNAQGTVVCLNVRPAP